MAKAGYGFTVNALAIALASALILPCEVVV